jgi:hypothetical protein
MEEEDWASILRAYMEVFAQEGYLPRHNARFARPLEPSESAFVPVKHKYDTCSARVVQSMLLSYCASLFPRRGVRQWIARSARQTRPKAASSAPTVVRIYHACAVRVGILTKPLQISVLTVVHP